MGETTERGGVVSLEHDDEARAALADIYLRTERRSGRSPRKRTPRSVLTPIDHRNTLLSGVYFVQEGERGPIKIGVARRVEFRFSDLQVGNPRPLRLLHVISGGTDAHERSLHRRFHSLRIRGEWFEPGAELLRHIKDLRGWP